MEEDGSQLLPEPVEVSQSKSAFKSRGFYLVGSACLFAVVVGFAAKYMNGPSDGHISSIGRERYVGVKASLPCTLDDTSGCEEKDVILYNPETLDKGRVKGLVLTFWDGQWGTVCDDVTNCDAAGGSTQSCDNDHVNVAGGKQLAKVVCGQLGMSASSAEEYDADGTGLGFPIHVDGTSNKISGCAGTEATLAECKWLKYGRHHHNCNHDEDVGVICKKDKGKDEVEGYVLEAGESSGLKKAHNIKTMKTSSPQECAAECDKHHSCVGFSIWKNSAFCALKNQIGYQTPDPEVDTYMKEEEKTDHEEKQDSQCRVSDPDWTCSGSFCKSRSEYQRYQAYDPTSETGWGPWCLSTSNPLCQEGDAGWCGGECNCPGSCQHACGRCP